MLKDPKAEAIVAPVLMRVLGPFGLERVEIYADYDYYDDPVVRANAYYAKGAFKKFKPGDFTAAMMAANEALAATGDNRFVHVQPLFQDGPRVIDEDDEAPPARKRKKSTRR
jgi:hypothetical protein